MKILVTGNAGFIGKSLVEALIKNGHWVIGIDKNSSNQIELGLKFIKKNTFLLVRNLINELWKNDYKLWGKPDLCIHLAALTSVDECREFKSEAYQNNVWATHQVVEECRKYNIPLIYAGSVSVYGNQPVIPTVEEDLPKPPTYYATTKLIGEQLVQTLPHWLILRFGTTYGADMRPVVAPYIFLKKAMEKQHIPIQGTGRQKRCFIYIDDLINGILMAIRKFMIRQISFGKTGTIINLAGSEPKTVRRLAVLCNKVVNGEEYLTIMDPEPARPNDTMKEHISIMRAERLLGWSPKVSLEEGLKKTYKDWMDKNG